MPVDYSKWDNLELSDDSDIEVHPNVDKRSFIRAKQNQIHAERQQRKLQIETLKYESQINDALIKRISGLLTALKANAAQAEANLAEAAFRAVMESAGSPDDDKPPPRPEGVHANAEQPPTYTKMMATLLDQVNQALNEKKPENRYTAMVQEIQDHLNKVEDLQKQLFVKLAELEGEEGRKITSESIHTGFNSSHVAKATPSTSTEKAGGKPELLNPNYSSSADKPQAANNDDDDDDDDDDYEVSKDGRDFGNIKAEAYNESYAFIAAHPHLLSKKEENGIMVLALDRQSEYQLQNKDDAKKLAREDPVTKNYIHQAKLLQFCQLLGRDGVSLFFKRIGTKDHKAREALDNEVNETYQQIKASAKRINDQRAQSSSEDVEQIQLHAVEPGTEIKILVPAKDSEDEEERRGRVIFESFAPDMRAALEAGSLDKVNEVLGRMKVEAAEEVVGLLSEAGILSMEEQIIDATTEEGKQKIKELEEQAAMESYTDDPE